METKVRNQMFASLENDERVRYLLSKPVTELVNMIIRLEEENKTTRDLRRRLVQIRNLTLDPGERNPVGRPRKDVEAD